MLIAPGIQPLQETRHSRELARRVDQTVRDYQRDNPDVSLSDIRVALMQSTPGGDSPQVLRRKQALAMAIGFIGVGVFTFMASTGGTGRFTGNTMTWLIMGIAAAALGVTIVIIRMARRG